MLQDRSEIVSKTFHNSDGEAYQQWRATAAVLHRREPERLLDPIHQVSQCACWFESFLPTHAAMRGGRILWASNVGDSCFVCSSDLSLPQHRPAERRNRKLCLRTSASNGNFSEPLLHSFFWRYLFAPDHWCHFGPVEPPHRPRIHAHFSGHLRIHSLHRRQLQQGVIHQKARTLQGGEIVHAKAGRRL